MLAPDEPRHGFVTAASRLLPIAVGVALVVQLAAAVPDRPSLEELATTRITIVVPPALGSFEGQQLEASLFEFDPRIPGRETQVDTQPIKNAKHQRGKQTTIRMTLGAAATLKPTMHYYVAVDAFNSAGKRTHLAEKDGKRGNCQVLTSGNAKQVTMTLREARDQDIVMDIAEEIKKGNDAKAVRLATARANDFAETADVMQLHRQRNRGGMGWGTTPGNLPAQDGIESRLRHVSKVVPADFFKDAKNNEEAAYWLAALAELTAAKPYFTPMGKKKLDDWKKKASQLRTEADTLARAIAAKDAIALKKSAVAIANACTECHIVYR